jgi:hypothetical protein
MFQMSQPGMQLPTCVRYQYWEFWNNNEMS